MKGSGLRLLPFPWQIHHFSTMSSVWRIPAVSTSLMCDPIRNLIYFLQYVSGGSCDLGHDGSVLSQKFSREDFRSA